MDPISRSRYEVRWKAIPQVCGFACHHIADSARNYAARSIGEIHEKCSTCGGRSQGCPSQINAEANAACAPTNSSRLTLSPRPRAIFVTAVFQQVCNLLATRLEPFKNSRHLSSNTTSINHDKFSKKDEITPYANENQPCNCYLAWRLWIDYLPWRLEAGWIEACSICLRTVGTAIVKDFLKEHGERASLLAVLEASQKGWSLVDGTSLRSGLRTLEGGSYEGSR